MKNGVIAAASLVLLLASACSSTPISVRVEWREPGKKPTARVVEFEEYLYLEEGNQAQVVLNHEEDFSPWDTNRKYQGETLRFRWTLPTPEGGPAVVSQADYQLKILAFFEATWIEGTVTPVPEVPESPGEFRLVFSNSDFGEHLSTITLIGRLRR